MFVSGAVRHIYRDDTYMESIAMTDESNYNLILIAVRIRVLFYIEKSPVDNLFFRPFFNTPIELILV